MKIIMLKTQKLYLRKLEEEDLKFKVKWINDEEINKTLMYEYPKSLSETIQWYKNTYFKDNRIDLSIIDVKTDKLIGMTGLINISAKDRNAELYITIGEVGFWGKGYAKESLHLLLEYSFKELGLEKIYLYTLENNVNARGLYERVGFKQEGLLRKQSFVHGKLHDVYIQSVLRSEY